MRPQSWRFRAEPLLRAEGATSPFVLTLRSIGDAVPVKTRQEDRISTLGTGLTATLEDECDCFVQDVSLSGLAAIATRKSGPRSSRTGPAMLRSAEGFDSMGAGSPSGSRGSA
jgi:hypothetical protein